MTADRAASSQPPSEDGPFEAGVEVEWEEVEDDGDEEAPRGWPLGALLATTVGIWLGRLFYRLPDNLEDVAAVLLALVTAIAAAGIYRRWVRRQFAQARARRLRTRR